MLVIRVRRRTYLDLITNKDEGHKNREKPWTYLLLVRDVVGELLLGDVGISQQHLDDRLGESLHEPLPDLGVRTLEFRHDAEALRELREHVHHGVGEEGVFGTWRELAEGKRVVRWNSRNLIVYTFKKYNLWKSLPFLKHYCIGAGQKKKKKR